MKRVALCVLLAACARPPPVVTPADAMRAHVPIEQLSHGRDLLIAKCGGCHDVPGPSEEPRGKWQAQLDDMAHRAGIGGAERHLIEQYLLVMDVR